MLLIISLGLFHCTSSLEYTLDIVCLFLVFRFRLPTFYRHRFLEMNEQRWNILIFQPETVSSLLSYDFTLVSPDKKYITLFHSSSSIVTLLGMEEFGLGL